MIEFKPVNYLVHKMTRQGLQRMLALFSLALLFSMSTNMILPSSAGAQNSGYGTVTGLKLPRYVSLRSSKVNARTGPALRYPIQWIYKRANMPVEITAEFDAWRQIKDIEGSVSWVHSTLLSGKRTALIEFSMPDHTTVPAYKKPNIQSHKVLEAENGAIGEVKKCGAAFCLVDFKAYRGWVEKKYLWGIYPDELIE
jgi:SH3-like domain-containing protein